MQTFLPYADFFDSLACLDYRRLGKQRVEAMQIIQTLEGTSTGWKNHPAVLMWQGYTDALKAYHNLAIDEWLRRGYKNTMRKYPTNPIVFPSWLGSPTFHASHRSNLLRKDPAFYGQYGWREPNNLPYIWPEPEPVPT